MMAATASEERSCSSTGRGSASRSCPAVAGEAAEVEATEGHGPSMLPDRARAPARSRTAPTPARAGVPTCRTDPGVP